MLFRLEDRFGYARPDAPTVAAIIAAFAAAGLFAGYVIASGRPVLIALTLGVIMGVALLNALPLVVWIVLAGALLVSGPVTMFVPALEKASWLFSMLGFFLVGASMLYPALGRRRFARPVPSFVIIAVLFFAFGLLSLTYSGGPLSEGIRAGKRYFQFFGLLFILAVVPFPPNLVRRWWLFVVALAAVQLPFALFQRIVLVPGREGMPGVVPIDIVVGTMEGSLRGGGNSSVLAVLLVVALSFALALHREKGLSTRNLLLLAALFATPMALGEVNLLFILLPLALAAIYIDMIRQRTLRFLFGAALALPLIAALALAYTDARPGETLSTMIEGIIAYNFGDKGYFGLGLNRTSVYPYWLSHHGLSDPVALLFGHGLGSSFGGLLEPDPGHMDQAHSRMFIGLTAASAVLWDLGLVGSLLLFGMYVSAFRHASLLARSALPGYDRALCRTLYAMIPMLAVMLFYSNGAISAPSQEVLTALAFGLIAWRWRSAERANSTSVTPTAA